MTATRGTMVLVVTALLVATSCRTGRPERARPPAWFEQATRVALGNGDLERAIGSVERGLRRHPESGGLLAWRALLAQMQWHDSRALGYLNEIRRIEGLGGLDRRDLYGRIGDLMFRTGSFWDSIGYLQTGAVGRHAERRRALVELALDLPYARVDPPSFVAELPLLGGSLPVLLCTLGERQRPFVLDTGASMTTLTRSLADELELELEIRAGVGRDGTGREFPVSFGLVDSLSLGAARLTALPVLIVSDDSLALRDPFGGPTRPPLGVVGLDILLRFRVTFDPGRRSLLVEQQRPLESPRTVECVHHDGFCLVPVTVDGRKLWFVLDTGASHSSLTEAGLSALPAVQSRLGTAFRRVRAPGGTQVSVRELGGVSIDVSAVQFDDVTLSIVARDHSALFPIHGVLGADLIMRCRTTFDGGRLLIEAL